MDDAENTAKVSDSAYSNSCSNSQSRRSHSSKSTHSGSNSSGSSGYGGKPSTSNSSSNNQGGTPQEKWHKEKKSKEKKPVQGDTILVPVEVETSPDDVLVENVKPDVEIRSPPPAEPETQVECMETCTTNPTPDTDEVLEASLANAVKTAQVAQTNCMITTYTENISNKEGFWCVISMYDGVVMFTTHSVTAALGFPQDMWIGRSFIDFVHPGDRRTFASQITSCFAAPKNVEYVPEPGRSTGDQVSSMFCRIRRYRGLTTGFGVKSASVNFLPFLLKLSFKNMIEDTGKSVYLVIQATPYQSNYTVPNEAVTKPIPFITRHLANGYVDYISSDTVPYLGYLPQDLCIKNILDLYHPDDLGYLRDVYEVIVKEGVAPRSKPYRLMCQNGSYLKMETEWSSFINPWSRKLEFVVGRHYIIEGPPIPDVFQPPTNACGLKMSEEARHRAQVMREKILKIINEMLTKPAEIAKQLMTKRCQDLAAFMENFMEEQNKHDQQLRLEIIEPEHVYERDSVMLGGISPHHENTESKTSTQTPLSYNQLNYNETLKRYFDTYQLAEGKVDCEEERVQCEENNQCEPNLRETCTDTVQHKKSGGSGDYEHMAFSRKMKGVGKKTQSKLDNAKEELRLNEALIQLHNQQMEQDLVSQHQGSRSSKSERDKAKKETRLKNIEHLARCNASFRQSSIDTHDNVAEQHGVKRLSRHACSVDESRQCSSPKQQRRQQNFPHGRHTAATPDITAQPPTTLMNQFINHIPAQMTYNTPYIVVPGMFHTMFYAPPVLENHCTPQNIQVPYMRYPPQPMVSTAPVMYTVGAQLPFPQALIQQLSMPTTPTANPEPQPSPTEQSAEAVREVSLMDHDKQRMPVNGVADESSTSSYYSYFFKQGVMKNNNSNQNNNVSQELNETQVNVPLTPSLEPPILLLSGSPKSTEVVRDNFSMSNRTKMVGEEGNTDESSYSSFYSSFFKTESEENSDSKAKRQHASSPEQPSEQCYKPYEFKSVPKRNIQPPWLEKVSVTSDLMFKYQIVNKNAQEVLELDQRKMARLEQSALVNEQLGQLYIDLQLEGVAARLTLEEGITSSSSSGEETQVMKLHLQKQFTKGNRRKREYSRLALIYEEDAPLPSPPEDEIDDPSMHPSGSQINTQSSNINK